MAAAWASTSRQLTSRAVAGQGGAARGFLAAAMAGVRCKTVITAFMQESAVDRAPYLLIGSAKCSAAKGNRWFICQVEQPENRMLKTDVLLDEDADFVRRHDTKAAVHMQA